MCPTGYTDSISKDISFRQYALKCARAFGACVLMRDEPMDAKIPEYFEPCDYHVEQLKEEKLKLKNAQNLTIEEAKINAKKDYDKEVNRYKKLIKEAKELKIKYKSMLDKVLDWEPPSPDHKEYKKFMIEQIETSVDHDCNITYYEEQLNKLKVLNPTEYKVGLIKRHKHMIEYHIEENKKEIERANSRTLWVKQLRESLPKD